MKTSHYVIAGLLIAAGSATLLPGNVQKQVEQLAQKDLKVIEQPVIATANTKEIVSIEKATPKETTKPSKAKPKAPPKCVFMTAFEGEGINQGFYYKIPGKVMTSIEDGTDWLADAQNRDGGWGAGSHSRQGVLDPHAVQSDPATTAMAAMALQRAGSNLRQGKYSSHLNDALHFLIEAVESSRHDGSNITNLTGTQPQSKLGKNIDIVLTSQFLSNIIHDLDHDDQLKRRVRRCVQKCVDKIEGGQKANGSQVGSGWAGVLQSSFATSALESAKVAGVEVDDEALEKSRDYQKNNINTNTNDVVTESAAGIVLYSVSGSTRASAKETGEAKDKIKAAKREGKIANEEVTVDNLQKAGMSQSQAMKYATAYQVNKSAKKLAQDDNVITGYGNNGGEEFLSYLQTGEGMIMSKDDDWKKWYDKTSNRLLSIQNRDGSWNGHHCITSPVFCTATCLLILSVNNDIDKLTMK